MSAITINGLSKSYKLKKQEIPVLHDIELNIDQGEFVALMGPSGSGKSTLLNVIGGIDKSDSGEVLVAGKRLDECSDSELTKWRGDNVGIVFQSYNLIPVLSAEENVRLPLYKTKLSRKEQKQRVAAALELVGLADRAKHKPTQLSGGQQQRIAIARALVSNASILICDEPTGDLDREMADKVLGLLKTLNTSIGKSIIMVTHDPKAASYADRILYMDKGYIEDTV
ncbi:ABC transporter ATP-binding protein [Shewanella woodyi]|uniref:ABC transporter ATP-binding protein n=1 Tax=Shewanella woodyi TaxID=60961 RepID=UPI00374838C3